MATAVEGASSIMKLPVSGSIEYGQSSFETGDHNFSLDSTKNCATMKKGLKLEENKAKNIFVQ